MHPAISKQVNVEVLQVQVNVSGEGWVTFPTNAGVYDLLALLATPSAQQSGLKINLKSDFAPNQAYQVFLDFDAQNSIVTQGNGSYSLKPVIKVLSIDPI